MKSLQLQKHYRAVKSLNAFKGVNMHFRIFDPELLARFNITDMTMARTILGVETGMACIAGQCGTSFCGRFTKLDGQSTLHNMQPALLVTILEVATIGLLGRKPNDLEEMVLIRSFSTFMAISLCGIFHKEPKTRKTFFISSVTSSLAIIILRCTSKQLEITEQYLPYGVALRV